MHAGGQVFNPEHRGYGPRMKVTLEILLVTRMEEFIDSLAPPAETAEIKRSFGVEEGMKGVQVLMSHVTNWTAFPRVGEDVRFDPNFEPRPVQSIIWNLDGPTLDLGEIDADEVGMLGEAVELLIENGWTQLDF